MSRVILRSSKVLVSVLLVELFLPGVKPIQARALDAFGELAKIEKAYDIEILTTNLNFPVKSTYGMIDGIRANRKELESYVKLFVPEFTIYVPIFVTESRLKRIVLCDGLTFAGQRRNAVPDFEHDTLYLDVSRGSYNKAYLRKVLHHEFFHIIDYRDDGSVYEDQGWSSLNPLTFRYGSGGTNAQDQEDSSILTDKIPGFLNYYSTTGVEEDKAEVFANLIVAPAYVKNRMKNDAVLRAKVKMMKELLRKFCPDINDAFWEKATKRTD